MTIAVIMYGLLCAGGGFLFGAHLLTRWMISLISGSAEQKVPFEIEGSVFAVEKIGDIDSKDIV